MRSGFTYEEVGNLTLQQAQRYYAELALLRLQELRDAALAVQIGAAAALGSKPAQRWLREGSAATGGTGDG